MKEVRINNFLRLLKEADFKTKIKMKRVFVAFLSILISINAISQDREYRKDERPQNFKEDMYNQYQVNRISELDMLIALELLGVRIFNIPISPAFDKKYSLSVKLDEYVDGKKINSKDILPNYPAFRNNTYPHYIEDPIEQKEVWYFDYISKITFFSKDNDSTTILKLNHFAGSIGGIELKKKKVRERQFYNWRSYSKVDWTLNEEVPLLVFASSYYDESIKTDRFCGVVDLSKDEKETKELFDKSPHYYVISLKVYE